MSEEWDYTERLHAAQRAIAQQRGKVYDRTKTQVISFTDEEREWLMAAEYKLLRIRIHTRSKTKAMDDLIDAANYLALLFDKWTQEGVVAKTSEEHR